MLRVTLIYNFLYLSQEWYVSTGTDVKEKILFFFHYGELAEQIVGELDQYQASLDIPDYTSLFTTTSQNDFWFFLRVNFKL